LGHGASTPPASLIRSHRQGKTTHVAHKPGLLSGPLGEGVEKQLGAINAEEPATIASKRYVTIAQLKG
jgi:hypothetical protein